MKPGKRAGTALTTDRFASWDGEHARSGPSGFRHSVPACIRLEAAGGRKKILGFVIFSCPPATNEIKVKI
jgi:hypothetical protein